MICDLPLPCPLTGSASRLAGVPSHLICSSGLVQRPLFPPHLFGLMTEVVNYSRTSWLIPDTGLEGSERNTATCYSNYKLNKARRTCVYVHVFAMCQMRCPVPLDCLESSVTSFLITRVELQWCIFLIPIHVTQIKTASPPVCLLAGRTTGEISKAGV